MDLVLTAVITLTLPKIWWQKDQPRHLQSSYALETMQFANIKSDVPLDKCSSPEVSAAYISKPNSEIVYNSALELITLVDALMK